MSSSIHNTSGLRTLRLRTPEGVSFSYVLASPISRMLALLVDALLVTVVNGILAKAMSALQLIHVDIGLGVAMVANFVITICYSIAMEYSWRGQTVGKRLLGLRVIDRQGLKLSFSQVVIRNLFRCIDTLPLFYFVGGLASFLSKHGQRLGDLAGNTVVIRHVQHDEPNLKSLAASHFNSLRAHPLLVARLRSQVSPQHASLLLQALQRRTQLAPEARFELFGELAASCRALVPFPPEVEESLTDEQYVRSVVDVLYEKAR